MKKFVSVLLVVIMSMSLFACGGSDKGSRADKKYVGKWISVAGETMGITLTGDDISGFDIELKEGGKGNMTIEGDNTNIKWTNDDSSLTITVEGEKIVATAGEDTLVFDDMLGMGMKVTFAKEGSDVANPENYLPENEKDMIGTWTSYEVTDVLGDDVSSEVDPDALEMTFKGDHTVDIEFNGESIPGQVWSMLDTWGSLDESEYDFSWDLADGELEVTYNGDEYWVFKCEKQ